MDKLNSASGQNILLTSLSSEAFGLLEPHFQPVGLELRDVLHSPHQPLDHAYFPLDGVCSQIAVTATDVRIEAGLIGREGFVGVPIALHAESSPDQVIVQVSGVALRIHRIHLLGAMAKSTELQAVLLRFVHTFSVQTAHTALANGRCTIEERLARWLLMTHDRVDTNQFSMTHEFLAIMLAVRRSGVTDALHALEGKRIIASTRGLITITDRPALEVIAGSAYGVPEQEYERLIAPLRRNHGNTVRVFPA